MLSHNQIKHFASLRHKKFRMENGKFLAEGEKIVLDIIRFPGCNIIPHILLCNHDFLEQHNPKKINSGIEVIEVSEKDLSRISTLSKPNKAILECIMPVFVPDYGQISEELSVLLEDISDPGNLGTIIRTADWFGIRNIFCSMESVDLYNPKVIQSTMGSICRVKIYYINPEEVISQLKNKKDYKIYGAVLDGENIYTQKLPPGGLIVLGNESKGISKHIKSLLDIKLTIPTITEGNNRSESLNIASAASIVFSEFKKSILFEMK